MVEDAVQNRDLYRVFVSRLFQNHNRAVEPPGNLERGG